MAEWLYEAGVGEKRAALVEHGAILAAWLEVEGTGPRVGAVSEARLVERANAGRPARVELAGGGEALLDRMPGLSEGAKLHVRILREAIPERGRLRPARATVTTDEPSEGDTLLARIAASGEALRRVHAHEPDALEAAGWSEVLEEARSGDIVFDGGILRMDVARAMTVFDIDGAGEKLPLALAGAAATARAIRRHDIGGNIGIDLPTLERKADRQAVDAALETAVHGQFEKTGMNGFGFVQIVRRRPRASLPERLAGDPVGASLRAALRRVERDPPPPGQAIELTPAEHRRLLAHPGWVAELERRTARALAFTALEKRG